MLYLQLVLLPPSGQTYQIPSPIVGPRANIILALILGVNARIGKIWPGSSRNNVHLQQFQ